MRIEHRCFLKGADLQVQLFGADPWKRAVLAIAVAFSIKESTSSAKEDGGVGLENCCSGRRVPAGTPGPSGALACSCCCGVMDRTEMPETPWVACSGCFLASWKSPVQDDKERHRGRPCCGTCWSGSDQWVPGEKVTAPGTDQGWNQELHTHRPQPSKH